MKPILFNQRVTVFTNSFIGYSDTYEQKLRSKFTTKVENIGMLQPNFAVMVGPQQIISPNQIPQNSPWFIIIEGIKVEFMPNKIDIVSDFITTAESENTRLNELINLLDQINRTLPDLIDNNITRIAYAPSFGLEGENGMSVDEYWKSIIQIPDLANSSIQEKMLRYNTLCKKSFDNYQDTLINRVVTISEGQRKETKTTPNGIVSKTIECVIISIDINTSTKGFITYSISAVNKFCTIAQVMGKELLQKLIGLNNEN